MGELTGVLIEKATALLVGIAAVAVATGLLYGVAIGSSAMVGNDIFPVAVIGVVGAALLGGYGALAIRETPKAVGTLGLCVGYLVGVLMLTVDEPFKGAVLILVGLATVVVTAVLAMQGGRLLRRGRWLEAAGPVMAATLVVVVVALWSAGLFEPAQDELCVDGGCVDVVGPEDGTFEDG